MTPSVAAVVLGWCRGPCSGGGALSTCYRLFPCEAGSRRSSAVWAGRKRAARHCSLRRSATRRELRFSTARWWPDETRGFEDLAFLFTQQPAEPRHHLAGARRGRPALPVGSRMSTAARWSRSAGSRVAARSCWPPRSVAAPELWSYDIHASHQATYTGADLDEELRDALRRLSLEERVHLVVGDSRLVPPPEGPIELLFVDGDHSYEGVSADSSHWVRRSRSEGTRCSTTRSTTAASGPTSMVSDASWPSSIATPRSSADRSAGGIAHFVRQS